MTIQAGVGGVLGVPVGNYSGSSDLRWVEGVEEGPVDSAVGEWAADPVIVEVREPVADAFDLLGQIVDGFSPGVGDWGVEEPGRDRGQLFGEGPAELA